MKKIGIIIVLLLSIIFAGSGGPAGEAPGQVNNELIRLHVLANSDSEKDQALKYKVKDAIVKEMKQKFAASSSINESREIVLDNLIEMENTAKETLINLGSDYEVKTQYGRFNFPTKYYGTFSLPAGKYEAVRVVIGEGRGANWWCVLFPPLCFVGTDKDIQTASQVKSGYSVNTPERLKKSKVRVSFKLVEWLKKSFPIVAKLFN